MTSLSRTRTRPPLSSSNLTSTSGHNRRRSPSISVDFRQWDSTNKSPTATTTPPPTPSLSPSLSPLARYVLDSFRRNSNKWCPAVLSDLTKLRRVTASLLTEIIRVSSFTSSHNHQLPLTELFHWAGKQKGYSHTYAAYNALAYHLNRVGRFRAADQVLELMQSQGKPPTEMQFEILIRFHTDAGRGLRVYHIYDKMRRKFGIKPRVYLFNRIIDVLIRTRNLELGLRVYEDFRKDGLKEDGVTFMIIAKGLCKEGKVDQVFEILGRMRSECCKPDVFAYTAMVKVLVGEGYLDGCLRIWEEMERDGVMPDAMAYTTVITGLCHAGRVDDGFRLFREMKKKNGLLVDRASYGALVDGFVKLGKIGRGCEILNEMVKDGYRPDLGIYDSLIRGMCDVERVDKADKLFRVVIQEGLLPGFDTVCPILMAYVKMEEMDPIVGMVRRMHDLGLPALDHLVKFFTVLVVDGLEQQVVKAVQVFRSLKEKGYCSVFIYNILIESLHRIGKINMALSLFKEMNHSQHFKPNSSTLSIIISCFVNNDNVKEACSCYGTMKEMSWIPSVSAYRALVKGLCRIEEINLAITLVKDCLGNIENGPIEFKYCLAILHAAKSGSAAKILSIINEMIEEQGHPPDDIIYCSVIHGFCKKSDPEEATKVFEDLRKRAMLPESRLVMYEDMLKKHLMSMTAGLVLSGLKLFDLESKLKLTDKLRS
ncbi:Pentatricopeptide repeat-containing protein [Zostera marina]|uniref:Pentatricopeptide repeat-containing protein n=1 Tax=Zostera marina TaxID=29655 RepID=A0A0K9NYI2_ZOSMR|nr:Pentatricopeptide repeat-containing protein [Zostera marina]